MSTHTHTHTVPRLALTIDEAAVAIAVSRAKMYDLLRRGEVAYTRVDADRRVTPAALEEYLRRHAVGDGKGARQQ